MKTAAKKIFLFTIFFLAIFSFSSQTSQAAGIWGESLYGAMYLKQNLEEMYKKINDTVVASLKMNAIRTSQSKMKSMLGGKSAGGQNQLVNNWRETIYSKAGKEAKVVVKDYFSQTKSGAGKGGKKIVSAGEKMFNTNPRSMKPTIDKYVREGRVEKIFDKKYTPNPAQALNDLSKMRNHPLFYAQTAQGIYATEYSERSGAEAAKDVAYGGYKGTDANSKKTNDKSGKLTAENITMPGSTKRDVVSETYNMPTKMLTGARSIPEVATAMVTQMLTQIINQGFATMNSPSKNTLRSRKATVPQAQSLIKKGWR